LKLDNLNSFPSKALTWKKKQNAVPKMTAALKERANIAAVVNANAV
jgi:hypothetical protein